ncbi:acyl-CoA dehydrogenase family protein [Variovorax dokdonensis]|uniref:Acyl-CoA dehydrogenase family protein n=1 Tax=Variovorax dokdonensis TaxID=344883 RepID=A0ABT7NFB9_9BURK|nr:acyl-CoA dehydrogenase family protein [Variovorax dokdonensis]MDM0046652.1 acyl-CoA dehydrogenase family protein [Variovorax dokdonensis]
MLSVVETPTERAGAVRLEVATGASDGVDMLRAAQRIAREVAAIHAPDVDAQARFPAEVLEALQAERLLSAPLPPALGGAGLGLRQLGDIVSALAEGCASSAMVLAMHYSQVGCLMRHGRHDAIVAFLRELGSRQLLVASITSEVGTAGDTRRSLCALRLEGERFSLEKRGTTASYGEQADAFLVTARVNPDAAESDQVLVLVRRGDFSLTRTTAWDTLGMRGTCSPGVHLQATGARGQIFPLPFADIAAQTMVPYAHILWSAVWTGIAASAYRKAAGFVRSQVLSSPGTMPPASARLAALSRGLQVMRDGWTSAANDFDALVLQGRDADECAGLRWAIRMNNLKISSSEAAPKLVHEALQIIGVAAYRNGGPLGLGREYRDALSASLMISNDRIAAVNASLLLISKEA